jgi:hypothetical protein
LYNKINQQILNSSLTIHSRSYLSPRGRGRARGAGEGV